MRISAKQNEDFTAAIMPQYPLDDAVEWIQKNMEPSEIFEDDALEAWAESAGWKKGAE